MNSLDRPVRRGTVLLENEELAQDLTYGVQKLL